MQANEDQSEPIEKNGLKCGWLSAAEAVAGNVVSLSTGSKRVPQHSSQEFSEEYQSTISDSK